MTDPKNTTAPVLPETATPKDNVSTATRVGMGVFLALFIIIIVILYFVAAGQARARSGNGRTATASLPQYVERVARPRRYLAWGVGHVLCLTRALEPRVAEAIEVRVQPRAPSVQRSAPLAATGGLTHATTESVRSQSPFSPPGLPPPVYSGPLRHGASLVGNSTSAYS